MKTWLIRSVAGLVVLILVFQGADRLARRADPLPPVPDPNAYKALLEVAGKVQLPSGDVADLAPESIRHLARANGEALAPLHDALRVGSGVPLESTPGWVRRHEAQVAGLKRLAVVLGLQARAELLEGRTNRSARCLLDIVLLGQALARGGTFPDGVEALAVETIGTAMLRGQVSGLDAPTCRELAMELERAEALREPPDRTLKTDRDWSAATFGLVHRVGGLLRREAEGERSGKLVQRHRTATRRTRQLMLALAARAVGLETGRTVSGAADLVPAVLRSVPVDPETGMPMTAIPGDPAR